jgi:hypothetical protein
MANKTITQLTAATTPLAGTEELPLYQTSTKKISTSDFMKRTFDDFGVNTNPSAWSASFTGVDIGSGGSMMADATSYYQGANWFWSGAAYVYKNNGTAVQSIYTGTGEYLIANAPAGTAGNAVTFTNRLYMYSEGTLGMKTGNIQFETAGKGIDFSANTSAPGMTSELLTWYEEGTWTPTYSGWTINPTNVFAKYTRVGRLVTLNFTAENGVSLTGSSEIGGLPFASNSQQGASVLMKDIVGSNISAFGSIGASVSAVQSITSATFTGVYWSFSVTYMV